MRGQLLKFVSRADQLQLRGQRNYGRWKMFTYGFVAVNGSERHQWERESAEESRWDAAWDCRHGPIPGGASILPWRDESERRRTSGIAP